MGHLATPRFPFSLIEPDVPISGIRLSDWFHRRAHDGAVNRRRSRRRSPRSPVAHALIDVSVNATECRSTRPAAEVV